VRDSLSMACIPSDVTMKDQAGRAFWGLTNLTKLELIPWCEIRDRGDNWFCRQALKPALVTRRPDNYFGLVCN
jgi:hypothetical protein